MLRVYDRLESNTSSLAVTSSKLWNHGHNEWSRVFCYPCMDGPVHTVLPNPSEETVQIYTRFLKKGHFLTENTCIFARTLIFLCKYCTSIMEEVKVICLSWLQPRLLKYGTIKSSRTEVMYNNISNFCFFGLVFVKFTLFNCVEIAYLSKTVREADSLSCVQSVNLITRFSSNEKLAISRRWGRAPSPRSVYSIKPASQNVIYDITEIRTEY